MPTVPGICYIPSANMETNSATADTTSATTTAAVETPEKEKHWDVCSASPRTLFPTHLPHTALRLAGPPPPAFPGRHRPPPPPDTPARPCSQSRKTATGSAPRRRCIPPPRHIRVFIAGTKNTGFFRFPASSLATSHARRAQNRRSPHSPAATLPRVMDGGGASRWLRRQPRLTAPRPACGDATASAVASCVPPCFRGPVAAHGR